MNLDKLLSIADFEERSRRRLPAGVYSFVAGGSEDEASIRGNRAAFDAWSFVPRAPVNISQRSQQTSLFGVTYKAPFGIAPMGSGAACRFEADLALARAAQDAGVPFVLSGASTTALERVFKAVPGAWFQAYIPSNKEIVRPLLARLVAAAVPTLVITVDVPIAANREREHRHGFSVPLRFNARLFASGLARPRWLVETFATTLFKSGVPRFENYSASRGGHIIRGLASDHRAGRDAFCWDDVRWIRDEWKGRLVVKGLLHPEDAAMAEALGVDGIILSNHGGRQLNHAISPLQALPAVASRAKNLTVMIDSGFRRGTDILKALALGARFVFVGRPAMHGVAVGGQAGVARVLAILKKELDVSMALAGCPTIADIRGDLVVPRGQALPIQ